MSFLELSSTLTGTVSRLSPILADSFINSALKDIFAERQWSFLQEDTAIICPTQIVVGAAAITYLSATVTLDAVASAALLPYVTTQPYLTNMQIRFNSAGNGVGSIGQIYQIAAVDSAVPTALVLTLDRQLVQATNAASGLQVFRSYVKPPVTDFLSWQSVVDMTNGWRLGLDNSSTWFDAKDPQRQAQGMGYHIGSFKGNPESDAGPLYEVWPVPTSGQVFYARYRRAGATMLEPSDVQPRIITDALILARAFSEYAYPWAAAQVARMPELRGVGWVSMTMDKKALYQDELRKAKRQDDEQQNQTIFSRGHVGLLRSRMAGFKGMRSFPIDSNFIQSHLVNF